MSLRNPLVDGRVAHPSSFRFRRFLNWFPLGLSYAMLYMGRYNLTVAKNELGELMTKEDFGVIFGAGTIVYAFAFLLNGPLTDKFGGRKAMLLSLSGSLVANLSMGLVTKAMLQSADPTAWDLRLIFSGLYALNMYFQSFGAVAIVKVNSSWFHVRERGGFSGIFGTMISSGIFLAFTVNGWIVDFTKGTEAGSAPWWVFFAPAAGMVALLAFESFFLRDTPGEAGQDDIETGDASSGDDGAPVAVFAIIKRILTDPIILTVAFIEFCTGVLRNGVMHWFPIYTKEVWALPSSHYLRRGDWDFMTTVPVFVVAAILLVLAYRRREADKPSAALWVSGGLVFLTPFLQGGWGGLLFVAGVIGGNAAGWVSDIFFGSRRAPAAALLYGLLAVSAVGMFFTMGTATTTVGWVDEGRLPELKVGDQLVSVAGVEALEDWTDVGKAVLCVPATCEGGSQWDTKQCTCATKPKATADALKVSEGTLAIAVLRAGERLEFAIKDPAPTMRAGDKRVLKAGPQLTLLPLWLGIIVVLMSLGVIGTHGLLSGTATMDFGGRRGAATAVGVIDGFVYLGTGLQSLSLGYLTSRDWAYWPMFLMPFALLGLYLLTRIWHAMPTGKKK